MKADKTPLEVKTFSAMVPASSPKYAMGTEEAVSMFRLTDSRALRKWHAQGMPYTRARNGTITYPLPDALVWFTVRRHLMARKRWRGNTQLDMDRANRIEMTMQASDYRAPTPMVLVPLDHDHPAREAMLRMAAVGRAPSVTEEDEVAENDDLTDAELDAWEPRPGDIDTVTA